MRLYARWPLIHSYMLHVLELNTQQWTEAETSDVLAAP